MLGLYVTNEHGRQLGFGQANGRYWSKIISGLVVGVGFLMIGWTQRKQGLHDKKGKPKKANTTTGKKKAAVSGPGLFGDDDAEEG